MENETIELIKKAHQLMRTVKQSIEALDAVLGELRNEKVAVDKLDAQREPRFEFSIAVKIPKDIYLTQEMGAYAVEFTGWAFPKVELQFQLFVEYYDRCQDKKNGKWSHWRKVWYKWVRTTYERETNGAKQTGYATRSDRAAIRS